MGTTAFVAQLSANVVPSVATVLNPTKRMGTRIIQLAGIGQAFGEFLSSDLCLEA